MIIRTALICTAFAVALPMQVAQAVPIDDFAEVVVFGDSLSDVGNVSVLVGGASVPVPYGGLIPPAPYESGRFSDGSIWADSFGVSASLTGGTGYAFGAARSGPLPVPAFPVATPSMTEQLDMYFADRGPSAPSNALFVIAGGGNDIRAAGGVFIETFETALAENGGDVAAATATAMARASAVLEATVSNVLGMVSNLAAAGARNLLVWLAPNPSVAPESRALEPQVIALLGSLAESYNVALADGLSLIELVLPALDIRRFDLAALLDSAIADPAAFGFSDATSPCVDLASVCANPDEFLFWDGLHPTSAGQSIIGEQVRALYAIPEPGSVTLLIVGIAYLLRVRRRARGPQYAGPHASFA